jgi:hypothetical protein
LDYEDLEDTRELKKKHFDFFVKRTYNFKYFKKKFKEFFDRMDYSIMSFPKKYYITTLSFFILLFLIF